MTTVGYGDITPTSRFSQSIAALEAILGQFFLAVMIARLVGMHIAHATLKAGKLHDDRED